jgi:hypothetical protein
MTKGKRSRKKRIRSKTLAIRRAIAGMDFVASGTMHERTKVCGRKNCKCATDPAERHGPYYEWSRLKDGKLRHKIVTPVQAQLLKTAISNRREIQALLVQWEEETASEILDPPNDDGVK